MWRNKNLEEETSSQPVRETPRQVEVSAPTPLPAVKVGARIGRTLSVKGELVGNEELLVDGEFSGTIDLGSSSLTVGPQGRLQADVYAREIVIEGAVRGKLRAAERLLIARTGNVVGDLVAARIVIEDGAYFKGSIDIQKPGDEKAARTESAGESFRIAPVPLAAKDNLQ
ncbi:MAG: bactofilin family protein [Candidatus Acidiferrales bacterium]